MPEFEEILEFWFGTLSEEGHPEEDRSWLWWKKNTKVDAEIRDKFEETVLAAAAAEREAWKSSPRGRLALILCFDQFPRNMYRGSPRAFAYDGRAQELCLEGLRVGDNRKLALIERVFFYMPLEHAEDRALQQRCVSLFEALRDDAPESLQAAYAYYVGFAERHKAIIDRFGRFPHRNAILDRTALPEEIAFLQEPGSSF